MIFAKKSLGQNFLISPGVVDKIIQAGEITRPENGTTSETILEIGPGKGILTKALLNAGAKVLAVEKDNRLIPVLEQTFAKEISDGTLKIIRGDILEVSDQEIHNIVGKNYKVIANIPYYITGQIIRKFLSTKNKPQMMIMMVQKEVATRILARDGKESILSLSIKVYAKPELVLNVSRGNFFPIPNVDSAVIKLYETKNPFVDKEGEIDSVTEERFFEIVKAGFGQKRKKLLSNLKNVLDEEKINEVFEKLNIDKNIRAEDVPLEKWVEIAKCLKS